MSHTPASAQVLLVAENPNLVSHAVSALESCGWLSWIEVSNCASAVDWLQFHSVDLVIVLLQPTALSGLTLLRHVWHGLLICLCDDHEVAVSAVDAARGLAILPPFATRQIRSALRLLLPPAKPLTAPVGYFSGAEERLRLAANMQAEQALRESERRLEQAQRMEAVGRLAGGIAHDFNNLLTVISSYSDLSLRKLDQGHIVARYVEQIRKASATAATLTRQLLAFSRRQALQPSVIALNEVVNEMSFMVQSLLGAAIEMEMRLDSTLGQIEADPVQLQQVLLNLIVNAKDAMPSGGLLTVETHNIELDERSAAQFPKMKPGAYVRLTVADTGSGMDADTLARIYEPFFTTKPKGRGTGLGLPTVYAIVQQSGGYISVYSEVGQGTTFHIYLPRVDKSPVAAGRVEETTGFFTGHETILLVEDEVGVRDLATTILQEAGYRLLIAGTPEEAITLSNGYSGKIDLLLTDVIMPRMTGREVVRRIAHRHPGTPVVYMSGYVEDVVTFQQLVGTGAYVVEKPFYPNDLLQMVRQAIEQPVGHELAAARAPLSV
ncbi:MAG: response regulator [Caldilineaceae bacterium]|nr:response regulator [Caldilineaceae bacterium]